MASPNQNPEQRARDLIDAQLQAAGWLVQDFKQSNRKAALGVAIREYPTDVGPADYALFVGGEAVGIVEAKRPEEGQHMSQHADQAEGYARAQLRHLHNAPLPFVYVCNGAVTQFTNFRDPKPRSRDVFHFHRPETLQRWHKAARQLRAGFLELPALPPDGLRACQVEAITALEASLKDARPKALVHMATGSGKTYTAITAIYRLLKFAKAERVLFLVDTRNLGEQAEQEFRAYLPQDDNRLFTELYNVSRLQSPYIPPDSQVYISTIQRLYAILQGRELDPHDEEASPNEPGWRPREPQPVTYSPALPVDFFDLIVIDECHRSIYNVWQQVLRYFDAFQVGLTATPDDRTYGYFQGNVVSEYGFVRAVQDGVLVPYNVYEIDTRVTRDGGTLQIGEYIDRRDRLTRARQWTQLDEDLSYEPRLLDHDVVNPNQIRLILQTIRQELPGMFPDRYDEQGRFEVPRTLIFAKSDSHAEDIIAAVRDVWAEDNEFCKKITYRSDNPKSTLGDFRGNKFTPRIAVTVDMIATGTDIRPLEVLVFLRDIRSRSYYEQMKGRGTRTCDLEELRLKGSPSAKFAKDHFVIIDAVGVEDSHKTDSRPLERHPGLSLKQLMEAVHFGERDADKLSSLANRLLRLERQLPAPAREELRALTGGPTLPDIAAGLLAAHDPDRLIAQDADVAASLPGADPAQLQAAQQARQQDYLDRVTAAFDDYRVRDFIAEARRRLDQVIDHITQDEVLHQGWVKDSQEAAEGTVSQFREWVAAQRDRFVALRLFYDTPYERRALTHRHVRELADALVAERPHLAPEQVWRAYERLGQVQGQPEATLVALVALLRHVCGIDPQLSRYDQTVARNFRDWVFGKQSGATKYSPDQMEWLHRIRDYLVHSFHIDREDFDFAPFNSEGGLSKLYALFGEDMDAIIAEMNAALTA